MTKIICAPGSYIQGAGEIKKLASYYQELGTKGAYLMIGHHAYVHDLDDIESSFKDENVPFTSELFGGECSREEVEKHQKQLGECDVVIGIGGGKTLDAAKAVAFYAHMPVIIVPTTASTDAPCSRLSVLYKPNGEFDAYLPLRANPDMVLMDTDIIAHAPVRFLMAGVGDALATYYEAAACVKSDALTMPGGHVTKAAFALATLCRDTLFEDALKAKAAVENKVTTKSLENIVEANTYLSGLGFESSGLAAAHAIHDGLTVIPETHKYLHGEKVAFGTITQLVLENRSLEEITKVIKFCKACNLPTSFKDLDMENVSDELLLKAATEACSPNDTMANMPFVVTPEDVVAAMKTANTLSATIS